MRKIVLGIIIWSVIIAASGLVDGSGAPVSPKIFMPEANWDFGQINAGEIVRHEFVVENRGAADLIISAAIVSCECSTALISKERIPPGKTGTIKVTFDSQDKNGLCSNTIKVCSNDPEKPFMRVRFWGTVVKKQGTEAGGHKTE